MLWVTDGQYFVSTELKVPNVTKSYNREPETEVDIFLKYFT